MVSASPSYSYAAGPQVPFISASYADILVFVERLNTLKADSLPDGWL